MQRHNNREKRIYYASVAYLQSTDDTSKFDELKEKGDEKGILALAREYYDGNGMDEEQTYKSACKERGDFLLTEDKDFAVVFSGIICGTYEVYKKYSEQEVRDHITRYGIGRASEDVREVAKEMVAEEFSGMSEHRFPVWEMPGGAVLQLQYNREHDSLDVMTDKGEANDGLIVSHRFPYDHGTSLEANLLSVRENLSGMEQYRAVEMEYGGGMRR